MLETIEEEKFFWMFNPCNINNKTCFYWQGAPHSCKKCEKYISLIDLLRNFDEMLEDFRNNIWTM